MRIIKRMLMTGMLMAAVFFLAQIPVRASSSLPNVKAKSALAMDAKTGQVLYKKNIDKPMAIASISKLMTIYIVHQQIADHKLSWDSKVKISQNISDLSTAAELTNVPLTAGRSYSVRSLVKASLIESANAAVIALGNKVAGSQARFAKQMNQTAKKMGIKHAQFYNAAGLTNKLTGKLELKSASPNAENKLSARGIGILAKQLLKKYPRITEVTSKQQFQFDGKTYDGHNQLLGNNQWLPKSIKVDGLKTGTSDQAGSCFVGTATTRGRKLVTVVLGTRNNGATDPARYIQTAKLLKWVRKNHQPVVIDKGVSLTGAKHIKVDNAKDQTVKLVTASRTWVWLPISKSFKVTGKFLKKEKHLKAPIKTSKELATANLMLNGKKFSSITPQMAKVDLVASKKVEKANPFVLAWRAVTSWF
ncbi:D-alanyl-D-alanine carboxypeptidase family protein [Lentilactobacillus sp. Marseille-Q4993]|uniref:D-alanyl-D-alanine carboxypeptidase family protein n=1 Tax=Lentilactobacillus sp. Marseille-Q4993 TaxID=3039492 RepID=UPI0024BD1CE1|nr:D-alanyl-D-alanine carboxypeptidase family protein [Lentilactobacillus sp. Marseille-Q4993]